MDRWYSNNPFHNHFIQVEPDAMDKESMDIAEAFMDEAYIKWACEEKLDLENLPTKYPAVVDNKRLRTINSKVQHLKSTTLERKL